jgi:hypothetical protein
MKPKLLAIKDETKKKMLTPLFLTNELLLFLSNDCDRAQPLKLLI